MRIRKNGRVIRLTESDLRRITRKVMSEQEEDPYSFWNTFKRNADYILGDAKRAFGETGEIPSSAYKAIKTIADADYGKILTGAAEDIKDKFSSTANDVYNTVSSWFNEADMDPKMQDAVEDLKDAMKDVKMMGESYRRGRGRSTNRRFR